MGRFGEMFSNSQEAATGELTTWRFHMADVGTETYEQEKNYLLASREGRLVWNIDESLRRLYSSPETFGQCDRCGQAIGYDRLDAIPYVSHCVACKQEAEGGQAE